MGSDRYAFWTRVLFEEMTAFLGFMILMGLVQLPALSDYCSRDDTFKYGKIADRKSRDRFLEIIRYLHFVHNTTLPHRGSEGYGKLGKVQPILDYVNQRFNSVHVHRDVSVDETMIPFKGRSSMKRYMPMPSKCGP